MCARLLKVTITNFTIQFIKDECSRHCTIVLNCGKHKAVSNRHLEVSHYAACVVAFLCLRLWCLEFSFYTSILIYSLDT